MKTDYADLHVHTTYSDGLLSPEEVVKCSARCGLKAIAITDHDCVDAITPAVQVAERIGFEVVPGIEISAGIDHTEIHVLGYFIDWHCPDLVVLLQKMRVNRIERMRGIVKRLREHGMVLDIDKVLGSSSHGTVGRLHLARIMKKEGLVENMTDAFDRYIGNGKPCYREHKRLDYRRAIDVIRTSGGVPVLAHPGTSDAEEHMSSFTKAGLRGIEVYHSDHRPAEERRYLKLAEEFGLLVTGGSDCHGIKKREQILIGTVRVGYDKVDELRQEAERIRIRNQKRSGRPPLFSPKT